MDCCCSNLYFSRDILGKYVSFSLLYSSFIYTHTHIGWLRVCAYVSCCAVTSKWEQEGLKKNFTLIALRLSTLLIFIQAIQRRNNLIHRHMVGVVRLLGPYRHGYSAGVLQFRNWIRSIGSTRNISNQPPYPTYTYDSRKRQIYQFLLWMFKCTSVETIDALANGKPVE